MRFVLTPRNPAAGWNPPTTGPTNHGQAQTLLRYRPRYPAIDHGNYCATHPRRPGARDEPYQLNVLSHPPHDVLMLFFADLDESTLPIEMQSRLVRGGHSQMILADAMAAKNTLRIVS